MTEVSKVVCAGALVALGLGSAFLCGPPADVPLVVHEPVASSERLQLGPLRDSVSAVRLGGDEKFARQIDITRNSQTGTVILSAASGIDRDKPLWQPRSSARGADAPLPPRMVEIDDEATPLLASSTPAGTSDEWLLKPPKIPRTYDGQATSGDTKPILASESTTQSSANNDTAWWAQDTPRLQGLSANVASASVSESQPSNPPAQPAVLPQNTMVGPIDLDPPRPSARALSPVLPAEPQSIEPMRMHRVADGDTLARLAARYLKDPNRAKEIFELNRDTLRHPELLPIGATLRIPGGAAETEPVLEDSSPVSRMVPVGPAPIMDSRPQAQLQGPTPIAASGW